MQLSKHVQRVFQFVAAGDFQGLEHAIWRQGEGLCRRRIQSINESALRSKKALPEATETPRNLAAEVEWWQPLFLRPSFDLGTAEAPTARGIFSPNYDASYVNDRLHEQFQAEGAENHSAYYVQHEWYESQILRALKHAGFDVKRDRPLKILDIGSGAGNTIFPLMKIFPQSQILASELSVDMLVQLKKRLEDSNMVGRCSLLQLDAETLDFEPESFDLVVGGAILHHLFHPESTLRQAAKVLKKGGIAIFFEPFSEGNMIIQVIMQTILDRNLNEASKLPAKLEKYMQTHVEGMDTTWGTNKSDPKFRNIDDKWAFPRHFIGRNTLGAGFKEYQLLSLHEIEAPFSKQLKEIITTYAGIEESSAPSWVWESASEFDRSLSPKQKSELLIEAAIILKK